MTYFDKILKKRDLETAPLPLWKLKITDEEYQELKEELRQLTLRHRNNCDNPFICRTRECTLFYAEYWRREYYDGAHSKQVVYDALESPYYNPDNCENFYQAAKRGAKRLKIELYADEGRTQHLDSMFYQGGLPMRLVTDGNQNSTWDRFVRGLVNRNVNFDELHLGVIASNSDSMREFCDWIIRALDAKQFMLMPFHCNEENNNWYVFLLKLKEEESRRKSLLQPFSLNWEFRIDSVEKNIYPKYVFKGHQKLPQPFIDDNGINPKSFTVLFKVNGKVFGVFEYVHKYCRYPVTCEGSYHIGDFISVSVDDSETPVITGDLDMSVPHLMYRNNAGKYELGNQIGRQESFLLIPEGWTVEDCHDLCKDSYSLEGNTYLGIKIPAEFQKEIIIKNSDGILTFGSNRPLYWTELHSIPIYTPDIVEPLYDASRTHFSLCNDIEDSPMTIRNARVEYRNKWEDKWKAEPDYGEIFARAIDKEGHFVTPVKFINIGNGVKVNVVSADENTCKIQVIWEHGRVTTNEGCKQENDTWLVNKENISNNRIRFTLAPEGNSRNNFDILVKAPFKGFAIYDTTGKTINSECWVPYTDIDRFEYHLIGQDIRKFTYGTQCKKLRWEEEKLYIVDEIVDENGNKKIRYRNIPYEGSLLSLFGSREEIRQMLDRTSQDMLHAEMEVKFFPESGHVLTFVVKDFPYRPKLMPGGKIIVGSRKYIRGKENLHKEIDFKGAMKLLKLDDPFMEPETLKYDEVNGYVLPEKIRSWGKTLVVGCSRGRILPYLVDLTREMTKDERIQERKEGIRHITEQLKHAVSGDDLWHRIIGWFHRTQKEGIPASSLWELYCVAQNPNDLLNLAFQLFEQCNDEIESDRLAEQMKLFSTDLSFSWYWLMPKLSIAKYFGNDDNDSFVDWMKQLCVDSLLETYDSQGDELTTSWAEGIVEHPDDLRSIDEGNEYIDMNQRNLLNEETTEFFKDYNKKGTTGNENWMFKRINAVAAHLKQKIDLFAQSGEIRRSIIFCCKSCNKQFIKELNNKLAY